MNLVSVGDRAVLAQQGGVLDGAADPLAHPVAPMRRHGGGREIASAAVFDGGGPPFGLAADTRQRRKAAVGDAEHAEPAPVHPVQCVQVVRCRAEVAQVSAAGATPESGIPRRCAGRGATREYRHRWIVRGHWRNQYYPSRNDHRPIWIDPHLAGPEDKPLLGGERVNVLRR